MATNFEEVSVLSVVIKSYIIFEDEEEGLGYEIEIVDSLKHPFSDFKDRVLNAGKEWKDKEPGPTIFLNVGHREEVEFYNEVWKREIKTIFHEVTENDNFLDSLDREIKEPHNIISQNLFFLLYINELFNSTALKAPYSGIKELEEDDLLISFFYGIEGYENYESDFVNNIINLWIVKEKPFLKGYQCFTRSFVLGESIKGRRITTMIGNPESDHVSLLVEGGLLIPLNEDGYKSLSYIDSQYINQWTVKDVEMILKNPVYAYGVQFEPAELFYEWQYVLLYGLATLPIKKYPIQKLEIVYESFMEKVKQNICYFYKAEVILPDKTEFLKVVQKGIDQLRSYLTGSEEEGISKNIIFLMKNRYAFLSVIYNFLESFFFKEVNGRFEKLEFNMKEFGFLLDEAKHLKSGYEKGLLFEEVASYFLRSVYGLKLMGHRIKEEREEVDLYFCNASLDPFLWNLGALISVECKNRKEKIKVSDVRNLVPVMDSKGIKTCIIFSMAGYTQISLKEIEHQFVNGRNIIPLSMEDLEKVCCNYPPNKLLADKMKELFTATDNDHRLLY
ncbi:MULTISPECIES: restriction endonuclease [Paenibacillus]|uniref:restriction endonuclease n=1 Tax=Paenibacillus TaxID=44249 RepID=UPI00096DB192|nr:hypothetical protein [Paenibacillus peoriae]OMF78463.1 hypothetical protein BK145_16385 [Paenibacillus peoriae]